MGKVTPNWVKIAGMLIGLTALSACDEVNLSAGAPQADGGVIDLTGRDFRGGGAVSLDGEWEIYRNQLVSPSQLQNNFLVPSPEYVNLPDGYGDGEKKVTLRLIVNLDSSDESLGFLVKIAPSIASRYFWNGVEIYHLGDVNSTEGEANYLEHPFAISVTAESTSNELIIQIAGTTGQASRFWESPIIGDRQLLFDGHGDSLGTQYLFIGGLLIFALFQLILYGSRPNHYAPIFLALYCIAAALRLSHEGAEIFNLLFGGVDWHLRVKLEYVSSYVQPAFVLLFFTSMYEVHYWRWLKPLIVGATIVIVSSVLLLPSQMAAASVIYFFPLYLFSTVSVFSLAFNAVREKKEEARLIFIGILILILSGANDISRAFAVNPFNIPYMSAYAALLFAVFQSLAYTLMSARVFNQKILDQRIAQNDERIRRLVDTTSSGIVTIDDKGIIESFNRAAQNIFGYAGEEALGLNVNLLMPEPFHSQHNHYLRNYKDTGKATVIGMTRDIEGLRKDGTVFPMELSLSKIEIGDRQLFSAIVQDITALKQKRDSFLTLFDKNPTAMIVRLIDPVKYVRVNQAACILLGLSKDELLNLDPKEVWYVPEDREKILATVDKQEVSKDVEIKIKHFASGGYRQISVTSSSIVYEGEPALLITASDITLRKREEEEIKRAIENAESSVRIMSKVFMDSADPIIIEDLDGIIIDANEEAISSYGFARDELLGQQIKILVPDDKREQADELRNRAKAGEKVRNIDELRWDKGKRVIPVLLTLSQLKDEFGETIAIATIAKDISEQKKVEQELSQERENLEQRVAERTVELELAKSKAEAATEAKAAFLATMSHEIRTPMNGIIGMVDLLRQSNLGGEHQRMLKTVGESSQSLLTIINDILDFSKIEAGKLTLEEIPFCLRELAESVVANLAPLTQEKALNLVLYVDPSIPDLVLGDPVRIRQILMNLGSNAVKFTERGDIDIWIERVERDDGIADGKVSLKLSVADEGVGISEKAQANLFQSFSQAESSTTRKYGGTGLGLAICLRLIELMDADISVRSKTGEGSTFTVNLKLKVSQERVENLEKNSLNGLKVLLISRNTKEKFVCRSYLEYWQAQVIEVDITAQPLDLINHYVESNEAPDLVIVGGGWSREEQLAQREAIQQNARLDKLRVLLLMRGHRSQPRLDNPQTVSLDGNPLRRVAFLTAVSIATGRASPEVYFDSELEDMAAAIEPLSIADAITNDSLILVAEDNLTNQDVISRQLHLLGYTCELFENGREALAAWETGKYALLLTDCHMPEMDGYQLTEAIRQREESGESRFPIVAITANALEGEAERCLAIGMDDYLSKPVALKQLRAKLRQWMPQVQTAESVLPENALLDTNHQIQPTAEQREELVVDVRVLKNLIGDDDAMVMEVLEDFINPSLMIVQELHAAYANASAEEVGQSAHKLKSSSRSIGANALADLCLLLESAGKSNDMSVIHSEIIKLDSLMAEVVQHIRDLQEIPTA